jgi:hypothetical protein
MDPSAASLYETRLRVRGRVPTALLVPFAFLRNVVLGALALSGDRVAPACIEVVRRSDGVLVGHIPVGTRYYEQVDALASVRHSLECEGRTGFLAAWHLNDDG